MHPKHNSPHTHISKNMEDLSQLAQNLVQNQLMQWGYPFNQTVNTKDYHQWLIDTGLSELTLINVGNPWKTDWDMLSTDEFERHVIDFWAKQYGYEPSTYWGVITNGGTDGNMHGIYFGRKALAQKSKLPPIIYVSEEAHYSVKKLADIQNQEVCIIKSHPDGQMDMEDFEKQLDITRPALVVAAIGGTFKSAMDDQIAIHKVLKRKKPIAHYLHVDMALMGGYLPFLDDQKARDICNVKKAKYDSLAVSGHKFMSLNEPCGIFMCSQKVLSTINDTPVPYLKGQLIPTISCSRNGFSALKMFWRVATFKEFGFKEQANHCLEMAVYLEEKLKEAGLFVLRNPYANTVCFTRPDESIVHKYALACGETPEQGKLSHVVTMQFITKELIDHFVQDVLSKPLQGKKL